MSLETTTTPYLLLETTTTPYFLLETTTNPSTTTPTTPSTTLAPTAMNKILYIDGTTGRTTLGNHTLINGLIRKIEPGENYIYTCTMYNYIYVYML